MSGTKEEEIAQRQAECNCNPDFHVCTAIAEYEPMEKWERQHEDQKKIDHLEELRISVIAQAKLIRSVSVDGFAAEFCNNVIELLSEGANDDVT